MKRLIAVLGFAAVSASCADAGSPATAAVTVDVEDAPIWRVASSFEVEQDEDDPFGSVVGGMLAEPGLVAVADGQNYRVVVADSTGQIVRTIGREGRGPLEFEDLETLARWRGDSVFAYDSRARRYSVFSAETGDGRTARVPQGLEVPVNSALPGDGKDGLWLVGFAMTRPGDAQRGRLWRVRHDLGYWDGAGSSQKIGSLAGAPFVGSLWWRGGPRTSFATSRGLLFLTEGEHPTVIVMGTDGAAVREITVGGLAIDVTDALRERFVDEYRTAYSDLDRLLAAAPVPQQMDAFVQVVVARDGTLWLGQRTMPGMEERLWLNVTPEGVPIRRVSMPPSNGVMLDAAGDRLLFMRADDMHLPYVDVHMIAAGVR